MLEWVAVAFSMGLWGHKYFPNNIKTLFALLHYPDVMQVVQKQR